MSVRTLLLVAPYFPPQGGGLELYVQNIASKLHANHGWRIVIATSGQPGASVDVQTENGLKIYRLGTSLKLSNAPLGFKWPKQLRGIIAAEKPDVINVHGPVPGIADMASAVSGKVPVVVTWHAGSMMKGGHWTDPIIWAYEHIVMRPLMRHSKRIISSSDFVRDSVLSPYKHKSLTINPGTDTDRFTPAASPKDPTILFVGGIGKGDLHKGLNYLLEALPAVLKAEPKAHLRIVGDGDMQSHYEDLATRLGVRQAITFAGRKYATDLVGEYQSARVLMHPTTNDSFGMVIAEAMACGRPVVASAIGDIPKLVETGVTGTLVPPADPAAIAAALIPILSSRTAADALGKEGRQRIAGHLSWTRQASLTHELLVSVVETNANPHIAEVVTYYPPHVGGMEKVVKELSDVLAGKHFDVEVLTSNIGSGKITATDVTGGAKITRLPSLEMLSTPIMFGLAWKLLTSPKNTIVHLHIAQALAPEITLLVAKLRGFPVISHIHLDVDPSSAIGNIIFRPYKRIFLARVLRHSDRVIVFSEEQKTIMTAKYRLDPRRLKIVPNGVGNSFFQPARTSPHQPLKLLYVGRIAPQKRVERIVGAMQANPDVHLDIVGDGDQRAELEAFTRKNNLTNITFHGYKQGSELPAYYQAADVLVMPSDREGMPLVALEAMAAGLPVIGSRVIGITELIQGVGILVDDPSVATFAVAIKDIATHPEKLSHLSALSRHAADAYSWDKLADQFIQILKGVKP